MRALALGWYLSGMAVFAFLITFHGPYILKFRRTCALAYMLSGQRWGALRTALIVMVPLVITVWPLLILRAMKESENQSGPPR